VREQHGKRDEKAFRGRTLGEAKTRAEAIGHTLHSTFEDIMRMLEALPADGIQIDPAQVSFPDDDVLQAAWRRFIMPSTLRSPLEPPMMQSEEEILRMVQ